MDMILSIVRRFTEFIGQLGFSLAIINSWRRYDILEGKFLGVRRWQFRYFDLGIVLGIFFFRNKYACSGSCVIAIKKLIHFANDRFSRGGSSRTLVVRWGNSRFKKKLFYFSLINHRAHIRELILNINF